MAERMIRKGEVTEIDPKTGKRKKVVRSRTPREALDMKTHTSPSVEPGKRVPRTKARTRKGTAFEFRDMSGQGPGTVKHPMGGLRAKTIQDEIEAATPAVKDRMRRLKRAPLPKKKPPPPKRKNDMVDLKGGGMMKMNYSRGGKVRGYGKAKGGRACKMVRMKGA